MMEGDRGIKGKDGSAEEQSEQVVYMPAGEGPALQVLSQLIVFKRRTEASPTPSSRA